MNSYAKHRFHALDGMRGIAAVAVVLYHYNLGKNYGFFSKALANSFIAVDFFFVLSGFVISYVYGDKIIKGLSAREYTIRRYFRMFPLLALGLLTGLPAFYYFSVNLSQGYSVGEMATAFLCNLTFLPYLRLSDTSSLVAPLDTPLWSIFFEMVASIGFIWLVRVRSSRLLWTSLICYGLFFLAAFFHGSHFEVSSPVANIGWKADNFLGGIPRVFASFIMGMLICRAFKGSGEKALDAFLKKVKPVNVYVLYLCLTLMLFCPFYAKGVYDFVAILLICPALVMLGTKATCTDKFTVNLSEFLGWISFPLYCLHVPVIENLKLLNHYHDLGSPALLEPIGLVTSLIVSIGAALIMDRLQLQKRLGDGFNSLFS